MNLKIFTDGGSRGNPGPAACAYVVYNKAGVLQDKCGKYLGITTNNEAEYQGVIFALESLVTRTQNLVTFYLDSLLVVQQLNGRWKIKEPRLRELILKVKELEGQMTIRYAYVPREQNAEADLLVNETLDGQMV